MRNLGEFNRAWSELTERHGGIPPKRVGTRFLQRHADTSWGYLMALRDLGHRPGSPVYNDASVAAMEIHRVAREVYDKELAGGVMEPPRPWS